MGLYVVKWSSYNESLVRRGEVILDFDVIDSWNSELKRMNNGKKGAQYDYPDSFVQLLGYMRVYFIYHIDKLKVLSELMLTKRYPQYQITVRLADVCQQA
jgi:hypothetical protein